MQQTHFYLLCGILGVVCHTLLKYNGLSTDAKKANTVLTLKQFVANDWISIVLSIVPVFVWLLTFGEAANKYPALHDYIRISFFVVGMVGSYALQLINNRSKRELRNVIDKKTDIADGKSPDSPPAD